MTMGSSLHDAYPQLLFLSRQEWRDWLEKNHARSAGIWMIYFKKKAGKTSVSYDDAVEEALCFGWVDSQVKKLDAERFIQRFTPRKVRSTWSKSNKDRVKKLIRRGCMTEAGMAKIRTAKLNGSWKILDDVENMVVPPDLQEALAASPKAAANFQRASASERKMYLYWLAGVKTEEARKKRIKKSIGMLEQNRKSAARQNKKEKK